MNENLPPVVIPDKLAAPKLIEAFDATIVDLGDGTTEIRIHHKGDDLVTGCEEGL